MECAFVVQLPRQPRPERGVFSGRVEHVDSGCSTHFETVEEFLAFVALFFERRSEADERTAAPPS
jgi:hypothetical protein